MSTDTQAQTADTGGIEPDRVEDHDGITVVRNGGSQRGWNGIQYQQGLSAKNVGAQALSINVATVPRAQQCQGLNH